MKIVHRIENELNLPGLVETLAKRCGLSDLTSLLLEVYRLKTAALVPSDLLKQYQNNRFVQPAKADVSLALQFDLLANSLLPKGFEMVELSSLAPLGSSAVLAPVNQNNAISTIRNVEVCSDPTNVLALESALRRKETKNEVRLASSLRVVRGQKFTDANCFSHFRLLTLTTAGKNEGSFDREIEFLYEHISYYVSLLKKSLSLGIQVKDLVVEVTPFDRVREPTLQKQVLDRIRSEHPDVLVSFDHSRESGRGYYTDVCYHICATDSHGEKMLLVDGGFTNWTQQLLGSQKERFFISGLGSERLLVCT